MGTDTLGHKITEHTKNKMRELVTAILLSTLASTNAAIFSDRKDANGVLSREKRGIFGLRTFSRKCTRKDQVCGSIDVKFEKNYEEFSEIAENDYSKTPFEEQRYSKQTKQMYKNYLMCHSLAPDCKKQGK